MNHNGNGPSIMIVRHSRAPCVQPLTGLFFLSIHPPVSASLNRGLFTVESLRDSECRIPPNCCNPFLGRMYDVIKKASRSTHYCSEILMSCNHQFFYVGELFSDPCLPGFEEFPSNIHTENEVLTYPPSYPVTDLSTGSNTVLKSPSAKKLSTFTWYFS